MLNKSEVPLTNTQISNFFLEQDYTDYFSIQEVISNLVDSNLIREESTHSNTQYSITTDGENTLIYFHDKLSEAIEEDVLNFFKQRKVEIKQENSIMADYYKTTNQNYEVRCRIKNGNNTPLDLKITVPNQQQAEAICTNWNSESEEVYYYLLDTLLK